MGSRRSSNPPRFIPAVRMEPAGSSRQRQVTATQILVVSASIVLSCAVAFLIM